MNLGILDFGNVPLGQTVVETIFETVECAKLAEKYGFSRYWLAEHYSSQLAWRRADLIINLVAGNTDRIKVGAAGVLLRYHSPFDVSQNYRTLSDLYPDRIDLGFSKGMAGPSSMDLELLSVQNRSDIKSDFNNKVLDTLSYFDNNFLNTTVGELKPECWMLGGSFHSQEFALTHNLSFAVSLFHSKIDTMIPAKILEGFQKNCSSDSHCNIVISAFVSENSDRIELMNQTKRDYMDLNICGSPDQCLFELDKIQSIYKADEIIILNCGQNIDEKILLLETFSKKIN